MKEMQPLVSIVIPALNEEKYIGKCLMSLYKQSYPKIEIIVVDGHSTDRTVSIAKKYADKVVLDHKRGIAEARNTGSKVSKGEIVVYTDADCIADCDWIKNILNSIGSYVGVIGSLHSLKTDKKNYKISLMCNKFVEISVYLNLPFIWGPNCAYKREVLEKIHFFNEKLTCAEDIDLCRRAMRYGRVKFVNSAIVKTSDRREKKLGHFKFFLSIIRRILQLYINSNVTEEFSPIR